MKIVIFKKLLLNLNKNKVLFFSFFLATAFHTLHAMKPQEIIHRLKQAVSERSEESISLDLRKRCHKTFKISMFTIIFMLENFDENDIEDRLEEYAEHQEFFSDQNSKNIIFFLDELKKYYENQTSP